MDGTDFNVQQQQQQQQQQLFIKKWQNASPNKWQDRIKTK